MMRWRLPFALLMAVIGLGGAVYCGARGSDYAAFIAIIAAFAAVCLAHSAGFQEGRDYWLTPKDDGQGW